MTVLPLSGEMGSIVLMLLLLVVSPLSFPLRLFLIDLFKWNFLTVELKEVLLPYSCLKRRRSSARKPMNSDPAKLVQRMGVATGAPG